MVETFDSALDAQNMASALRRGRRQLPAGRWEFEGRQVQPDVPGWGVWARWLGPDVEVNEALT